MSDTDKRLAAIGASLPIDVRPPDDIQAAGHMIYEYIKGIANGGVDRGMGYNGYDIWFEFGETKIFLTLGPK